MDSARVERLAAVVATMPDGPSRERFVVLLEELGAEEQVQVTEVELEWDDTQDAADPGDPGDPIRDGISGSLAVADEPAAERAGDVPLDPETPPAGIAVPAPPQQQPPTAPEPEQPAKKRRWRKKD